MIEFQNYIKCDCGKLHNALIDKFVAEKGAIKALPVLIREYNGTKAFILADKNTYKAAGKKAVQILSENEIAFSLYVYNNEVIAPDEYSVGSAVMNFDNSCDIIVGVGSGVINDIGKILSNITDKPYIIVATTPSMDGYASATSSMEMDGLKISIPSKCADVVIGDIDILKNAPERMLISGLGDMLAKYISICEWRIANIITGEYYCEKIAHIVRDALNKCVTNAGGLLKRDENAVQAVFEGLFLCGVGMNYAGLSRPASGVEHYFSHIWDMRGLEFGTKVDFHGIQCAVGTMYATKIYENIKGYIPDREIALKYAQNFDYDSYKEKLKKFLGTGADVMIALEEKDEKYNRQKHAVRLEVIIENWDKLLKIIEEEVPTVEELQEILNNIKAPKSAAEIGMDENIIPMTFAATKDIRDKYVVSRLCWDLGIIDEMFKGRIEK